MHRTPAPSLRSPALAALAAAFFLLYACAGRQHATQAQITVAEPLETSELALLMRHMATFSDSTRVRLLQGNGLLPYPEEFNRLKTAEPTPGMVNHATFDPYATAWLHHLDNLYKVPPQERVEVYNTLVQTCAACHGQMCPGPLVKIKKLGIPQD